MRFCLKQNNWDDRPNYFAFPPAIPDVLLKRKFANAVSALRNQGWPREPPSELTLRSAKPIDFPLSRVFLSCDLRSSLYERLYRKNVQKSINLKCLKWSIYRKNLLLNSGQKECRKWCRKKCPTNALLWCFVIEIYPKKGDETR